MIFQSAHPAVIAWFTDALEPQGVERYLISVGRARPVGMIAEVRDGGLKRMEVIEQPLGKDMLT
jgi:hypothetical protein